MTKKPASIHPSLFIGFAITAASNGTHLFLDGNMESIVKIMLISIGIFCLIFGIVKTIKMWQHSSETTIEKKDK